MSTPVKGDKTLEMKLKLRKSRCLFEIASPELNRAARPSDIVDRSLLPA